jgi:hypothetical protein
MPKLEKQRQHKASVAKFILGSIKFCIMTLFTINVLLTKYKKTLNKLKIFYLIETVLKKSIFSQISLLIMNFLTTFETIILPIALYSRHSILL